MSFEGLKHNKSPERPASAKEKMRSLLREKMSTKDFYLEDGESEADVLERCELLEKVLDKLDVIAPQIIKTYREILNENGISEEQTGKLSLVIVGGRVHGESQLKTWSDIDSVITAEKPFLATRRVFLTPEEESVLPEPIIKSGGFKREMVNRFVSSILPNLGEMIDKDLTNEGIFEIKGYGDQRNEDVKDGLVIFTE